MVCRKNRLIFLIVYLAYTSIYCLILNKTELAATTDSLTEALNRVSYKKDILKIDEEKPKEFSCIYIDVNKLHIRNNKYCHAAGDEMLIYIANTLKEVFLDTLFIVWAEMSS